MGTNFSGKYSKSMSTVCQILELKFIHLTNTSIKVYSLPNFIHYMYSLIFILSLRYFPLPNIFLQCIGSSQSLSFALALALAHLPRPSHSAFLSSSFVCLGPATSCHWAAPCGAQPFWTCLSPSALDAHCLSLPRYPPVPSPTTPPITLPFVAQRTRLQHSAPFDCLRIAAASLLRSVSFHCKCVSHGCLIYS